MSCLVHDHGKITIDWWHDMGTSWWWPIVVIWSCVLNKYLNLKLFIFSDGNNCELKNYCDANNCLNSGTCISSYGGYICKCMPGYAGPSCQFIVDNCSSRPCLNSGICQNAVNSLSCTCTVTGTGGELIRQLIQNVIFIYIHQLNVYISFSQMYISVIFVYREVIFRLMLHYII